MALFRLIRNFLHAFWTAVAWTRKLLVNIIFLFILIVFVSALFVDGTPKLAPESILVLDPSGVLVEECTAPSPLEVLFQNMDRGPRKKAEETKMQDILDAVRLAAQDPKIAMMVIDPRDLLGCDTSKLMDISKALGEFKNSGKPIFAHATTFTQGQYLLASNANATYISPLGGVVLTGFGLYPTYFKGLLDKTKVNFHIFRVGEYKSAVEPFLRDSMSEPARKIGREWLNTLWQTYLGQVAKNRDIATQTITSYVKNIDTNLRTMSGNAARLALAFKLVDAIKTSDEFTQLVAKHLGQEAGALKKISFKDYLAAQPAGYNPKEETIGIIRARGPIVPDNQPENMIGSQSMAKLFQQARDDASVVAVVLRIDSPGGSATASEEIHQEIMRTQQVGKPVVISMGSVAASGAYWLASGANRIIASPTTLTGSIGIFAAIPTFENTAKALGITSDGVGTTNLADLGNPLRPLSPTMKSTLQHLLHFGYQTFVDRVAVGRRLDIAEVEKSAQGQVFLGQEAQKRKLVDQLGDLDDALQVAANLAGLTTVRSKELQREHSVRELFMRGLVTGQLASYVRPNLANSPLLTMLQHHLDFLGTFTDPGQIYARSLECEAVQF